MSRAEQPGDRTPGRVACPTAPLVIIGYGNDLRGDDGVGPLVAERVAAWERPGVVALARPQLTPELAADLAGASRAVFVDVRLAPAGDNWIEVYRLEPADGAAALAHSADPRALLALSAALYGRWPPAWLITIPGSDFSLGAPLSAGARRGAAAALACLRALL